MTPLILDAVTPEVVRLVRAGELIAYPTETLYGLGCRAEDAAALERLLRLKGRTPDQPLPVLIGELEQLAFLVRDIPPLALPLIKNHWPGSLTLILPAHGHLPRALLGRSADGQPTVGVRWTGHPLAGELCRLAGPLVGTSANLSGAQGVAARPARLEEVDAGLTRGVGVVLRGACGAGEPSTVVDCTGLHVQVLRQGAVHLPA